MPTRQQTPKLIGREAPLRLLADALAATADEGTLAVVTGEAGLGKTRLLDEFARRTDDTLFVPGGCVEGVAYAPWTQALSSIVATAPPGTIEALPERALSELGRLVPGLPGPAGARSEDGGQQALFESVLALLAETATRAKVVLTLDDVHWIDPASAELLRYLATALRRVSILLVVAYRPEDSMHLRELTSFVGRIARYRIDLEPLTSDDALEMVAYLLGEDATSGKLDRIVREADGNPLFVEELAAASDDLNVPPTIRDLMLLRFRSLDDNARRLVHAAAVIGARVPRGWLVAASDLAPDEARPAARAAVDTGVLIVDPDAEGYAFKHDLLREAIVGDLVPDERVALHRAVAAALTGHPERAPSVNYPAELARHWDAADDARPALEWLTAAAQAAEAQYAFEAAAGAYERALTRWPEVSDAEAVAGVDHAELLIRAAHVIGFAGHVERAAELGHRALEEASALDLTRGVDAAGRLYPVMWTADRARELFEFAANNLLVALDDAEPVARARFLMNTVKHQLGRVDEDETRATAALMLDAVSQVHDATFQANAHAVMAHCYEAWGDLDRVDAEYERAAELASAAQSYATLAVTRYNHASFMLSVAQLERCLETLDEVDALVEQYGLRRYAVAASGLRVVASCLSGDLVAADAALRRTEHISVQGYDAWFRAYATALFRLYSGDWAGARAVLDPGAVGAETVTDSAFGVEIAMVTADALAWEGDIAGAREQAALGYRRLEDYYEAYCHGWLARVAMRVEADAAIEATQASELNGIERAELRAADIDLGWSEKLRGLYVQQPLMQAYSLAINAEHARLHKTDTEAAAERAAVAFEAIGYPYDATYYRYREAEAALERNDRRTALQVLKRVRAVAQHHGFHGLDVAAKSLARKYQVRIGAGGTTVDGAEPLSVREMEVLRQLVSGLNNREIADELCISRHTARAHVSSILRKLGASSRVEAVTEAARRGLA